MGIEGAPKAALPRRVRETHRLITHIDRTTVLYKHVYQPYRCVQSAVYAAEHNQNQLFLGYALALFRIKIFGN